MVEESKPQKKEKNLNTFINCLVSLTVLDQLLWMHLIFLFINIGTPSLIAERRFAKRLILLIIITLLNCAKWSIILWHIMIWMLSFFKSVWDLILTRPPTMCNFAILLLFKIVTPRCFRRFCLPVCWSEFFTDSLQSKVRVQIRLFKWTAKLVRGDLRKPFGLLCKTEVDDSNNYAKIWNILLKKGRLVPLAVL